MSKVIAIDGPSGAGKSTIARGIGKRMNFLHVDSGSLYRIMTLMAMNAGVDCEDADAVVAFSQNVARDGKRQRAGRRHPHTGNQQGRKPRVEGSRGSRPYYKVAP